MAIRTPAWITPQEKSPKAGRRYIVKVKMSGGSKIIISGRYTGACLWSLDLPLGNWQGEVTHYARIPK